MKSASTPPPPDPVATAKAQTTSNVNTAVANTVMGNANEKSPLGSVTYRQIGTKMVGGQAVPQYERVTSLSPEQQKLYDQNVGLETQQNAIAGRELNSLDSSLSQPFNLDGIPEASAHDRGYYEDAMYGRLEPQMQRDREALQTELYNKGIREGSDPWREAMALSDRQKTDARLATTLQAGQYADQEMSQSATARERAIQERLMLRQQPINEIGALMSGGQATIPQFTQYRGGNVAGTDVAGITQQGYQNAVAAAQAKNQQKNAMMGGLFSLGGSLLAAPVTGGGSLGGLIGGKILNRFA